MSREDLCNNRTPFWRPLIRSIRNHYCNMPRYNDIGYGHGFGIFPMMWS